MSVTVILPSALTELTEGRHTLHFAPGPGMTLADLLDALAAVHPAVARRIRDETGAVRQHVNVFIDADECRSIDGITSHVSDGAVVHIIPSVSGG